MAHIRYAPQFEFPPFAYVPGERPRAHEPGGNGFRHEALPPVLPGQAWYASETFWFGVDLFNHGFYWEAHEAWESLWHALGRRGAEADIVKGLIKLAAAGVKAREGRPGGIATHSRRAEALFTGSLAASAPVADLPLDRLIGFAAAIAGSAERLVFQSSAPAVALFAPLPLVRESPG